MMSSKPTDHTLSKGAYRYTVGPEMAGLRLDQVLARCHAGVSRGLARRFIDLGGVHLDGRRMRRCGQPVSLNQRLELFVDGLSLEPFSLNPRQVLFQDQDLLVIDKPAGVATQPTPARFRGTLYDAVLRYLDRAGGGAGGKPGIGMVQRLDRDTTGVIVFSIHRRAHKALTTMFAQLTVEKSYLALVQGVVADDAGLFQSQLARKRATNRTVSVRRGGRAAETRFRTLARYPGASQVEIDLISGRTHQIRAHFSEAGHPLVGDVDYGGCVELAGHGVARQMLHASRVALPHPVTGEALLFHAPLPHDFTTLVGHLEALCPSGTASVGKTASPDVSQEESS